MRVKDVRGKTSQAVAAWTLSVGIHAGLLLGFGQVTIRPGGIEAGPPPGRVCVEQVRRMIRTEPVTSKPVVMSEAQEVKVSPPAQTSPEPAVAFESPQAVDFPVEPPAPELTFFGQATDARRIAFVVDCSGSMFGRMGLVKGQLRQSIAALRPDQYFAVLFFSSDGRIIDSGSGELRRATKAQKQQTLRLVDSVVPGGRTQALAALERALGMKAPGGKAVEAIYFLTDGFDLEAMGEQDLLRQAAACRQTLAPDAVIHSIGFWAEAGDCGILNSLAAMSGGSFTVVSE